MNLFLCNSLADVPLLLFIFPACICPVSFKLSGPEPIYNVNYRDGKVQ